MAGFPAHTQMTIQGIHDLGQHLELTDLTLASIQKTALINGAMHALNSVRMEPLEVDFFAEKEVITIIPNFSANKICLISGDFGPFNPSMQTQVPLWLALNLKQRQKCRLEAPSWLCVDELSQQMSTEKTSSTFTEMASPHYMQVASMLLNNASDDISRADEVRALVKDLWDLRIAKLRKSVGQMITQQETYGKLDNLTVLEINTVRQLLTESLNHTHLLHSHATQHASSALQNSEL